MNTQLRDLPLMTGQGKALYMLQTGAQGVVAAFTPALYHLRLLQPDGESTLHDLGYAGTRLLECLISSRGNALSREELTAYAWPDRVVGQGSLNQQIYTLRQLLCDDKQRAIIQTLPRRGYLFDSAALIRVELTERSSGMGTAGAVVAPPAEPEPLEFPEHQRQLLARAAPLTLAAASGSLNVSAAEVLAPGVGGEQPTAVAFIESEPGAAKARAACPFAKPRLDRAAVFAAGGMPWLALAAAFGLGLACAALTLWGYRQVAAPAPVTLYEAALPSALGAPVTLLAARPIATHPARAAAVKFAAGITAANVELVLLDEHLVVNCVNAQGVNEAQLLDLRHLEQASFSACVD